MNYFLSGTLSNTTFSRKALYLATILLSGCATPASTSFYLHSPQRIVVAQPATMHDGIFLTGKSYRIEYAYRKFCDGLIESLRTQGHTVLDYCSKQNAEMAGPNLLLPIPDINSADADVILVPRVVLGYVAPTRLHSYKVVAHAWYQLVDIRTKKLVGQSAGAVSTEQIAGLPIYFTADELISDLPKAIEGLTVAATALGKKLATRTN